MDVALHGRQTARSERALLLGHVAAAGDSQKSGEGVGAPIQRGLAHMVHLPP